MAPRTISYYMLDTATTQSGLYAWNYDFKSFSEIASAIVSDENANDNERIKESLAMLAGDSFRRFDYEVTARSDLQPCYSGKIVHDRGEMTARVRQVTSNTCELAELGRLFEGLDTHFTCPLYIGQAVNIRSRLRQHADKILRYRDTNMDRVGLERASFAREVVLRRLDISKLIVTTVELPGICPKHLDDLEYILNRISYPLFGRL
jgi:hypothetical protein